MKTLILLALVGFVLAVGLAVPLSEDIVEANDAALKEIGSEFQAEDTAR